MLRSAAVLLLSVAPVVFAAPPALLPGELCEQCSSSVFADFNGDGLDDVLSANDLQLRFNIDGRFGPPVSVTGLGASDAFKSPGDYNGDGLADVIARNVGSPHAQGPDRLMLGNGSGGFTAGPALPAGQFGSTAGNVDAIDWNGDGKLDLVMTRWRSTDPTAGNILAFLRGNGDGTFTFDREVTWMNFASPRMAFADFNRDGRRDAVLAAGQYIHFFMSDTSGAWSENKRFVGVDTRLVPALDLNGDGNADVAYITADAQKTTVTALFGDGTGHFLNTSVLEGGSFRTTGVGDFFGGGGDELAYVDRDNSIKVVSGTGTQLHIVAATASGLTANELRAGRFHSGGGLDLLATGSLGFYRPALRVIVADGALPSSAPAPSRRVRAVSRGSAMPVIDVATYEGRTLGLCPVAGLDVWSFRREGVFVDFADDAPIEGAMVDGKMVVRVTTGGRVLRGTLTVTADALSGELADIGPNPCVPQARLSVYARRIQ